MKKIESPCLSRQDGQKGPCPHKDRGKNSETCTNCERRIAYATEQGMIHVEKKPICVEDGCEDPAKIRGRCGKHYQKWRLANPDKMGKRGRRPSKEPSSPLRREYSDIKSYLLNTMLGKVNYQLPLGKSRILNTDPYIARRSICSGWEQKSGKEATKA